MINGTCLRNAIISGANNIAKHKTSVDELNIFPVPDGDPGTNMSMTMSSAAAALEKNESDAVGQVASACASALLRGARGNSGVILSLLFRGFAQGLKELDVMDGSHIATALGIGVEAAYINAQKTGVGQMVDVALVDSVVSSLEVINQIYLASGRIPERIGNRYEATAPYDSFHAKDGDMVIAAGNNKLFALLCGVMGKPELVDDPRFLNVPDRVENQAILKPIIEDWLKDYTIDEAVEIILASGCPAAPINTIDRIVADPHIAGAREMFVTLPHPTAGDMKICGNQIKLSETPVQFQRPAPLLGQHEEEILHEMLGLNADEVKALKEEGVL